MPILNTDFRCTLHQDHSGQPCMSVFWYRKLSAHAPGDAQNLWAALNTDLMNAIIAIQHTGVVYTGLEVVNLVDPTDYWSADPTAVNGAIASTSPAPRFVAYGFRLNRSTRAGRHGYKRFVGVAEELVSGGSTSVSGALITAIPNLATVLAGTVNEGGNTYQHMIPHRVPDPDPPLGEEDYILTDLYPISGVTFYGLTSQNTRKR